MELIGKVVAIPAAETFTTKQSTNYSKRSLVLSDPSNPQRLICVDFTEKKIALLDNENLKAGKFVTVQVDIESKQVNGQWFTNLRGWRIDL